MFRNLPNLLTILRLLIVPFVAERLFHGHYRQALILLLVAGITDGADGWLARRFQWTSRLGARLDPIADKALLITVYLLLGVRGVIPMWLAILVPGRDVFILAMVAAGMLFTSVRDFPPSVWGKVSTIVQVAAALGFLADAASGNRAPAAVRETLLLTTAAATIWSGLDYARRGLNTLNHLRIDAGNSQR